MSAVHTQSDCAALSALRAVGTAMRQPFFTLLNGMTGCDIGMSLYCDLHDDCVGSRGLRGFLSKGRVKGRGTCGVIP